MGAGTVWGVPGGAAVGPLRAAAAVLPVNGLGGDRDGLGDIGGAAGPRAAAALLPVNGLGGGPGRSGRYRWCSSRSALGSSSDAAGERLRWGPGRSGRYRWCSSRSAPGSSSDAAGERPRWGPGRSGRNRMERLMDQHGDTLMERNECVAISHTGVYNYILEIIFLNLFT